MGSSRDDIHRSLQRLRDARMVRPVEPLQSSALMMRESELTSGSFHISEGSGESLCGAPRLRPMLIPVSHWGEQPDELRLRTYCPVCARLAETR
jgi:hypothetical protein